MGEIPLEEEATDEASFEQNTSAGSQPVTGALTVGQLIDRWGCTTGPTMDLNEQIADQMNCIADGFFERIDDIPNVELGAGANPYLQSPAARALRRVAAAHPSATLHINSSWRSVAQQHILKSWEGSCGISIASSPGRSNHESGLAIDVPLDTTMTFRSELSSEGFRWYCDATNGGSSNGCRDRPHHDYTGGGVDLRSRSVLAFQQLWNRAHPEDPISEDGEFGSVTASRLRQAPLSGFLTGTTCSTHTAEPCGDGFCLNGESCESCPQDCGGCAPECGDDSCDGDESCESCSADCGGCPATCGDDSCDEPESCESCPQDCGRCPPSCGNGSCDPSESCVSCSWDCGECPESCGNDYCAPTEDCQSCPQDCGACPEPGCQVEGHGGFGENADTCADTPETWRCVYSQRWGEISQVCRSGQWLTFHVAPQDCSTCCGEYSWACHD